MTRTTAVNFSGALQFPMADAGTDIFVKEDVQTLAKAVDGHDHTTGKGLALAAGSIPNGTITSAMIADGTIVAGDIADGAVTSAKILDGTIATTDLADGAVTNAKLGSDTARANLLTNGGFEIWQRGGGPFTVVGGFNADRWQFQSQDGDAISVVKDTTNVDVASNACAACTFTRNGVRTDSGLIQVLVLAESMLKSVPSLTFSVRVRTGVANAVKPAVLVNGSWSVGTAHSGSGAYETLTITTSGTVTSSPFAVGVFMTASLTAYVDNAALVVGSVPANYAPLHPADDLARCLRYYESGSSGFRLLVAHTAAQTDALTHRFYVKKAVTPTMTKNTWGTSNMNQPSLSDATADVFSIQTVSPASGSSYYTSGSWSAEANP